MKKFLLVIAAAALTVSANAQKTAVTANKATDNIYVGVKVNGTTPTLNHAWIKDVAPGLGVRVGKNLTTVFGVALEADAYHFHNGACYQNPKTFVDIFNVNALGTFNLTNLFGGYTGSPRFFEVVGLYGLGWGHVFGVEKANGITSKVAVDFAFNLGADKAWQVYVEPSLNYGLQSYGNGVFGDDFKYNLAKSNVQLSIGVNYKFLNSNGTHNFAIEQLRDQAEIDGLNARINGLRSELDGKDAALAAKDRQIADLQKALDECNAKPKYVKPETATNLQPTVLFRQGKSVIDKAQYAPIELIATYMKNHPEANVEIKGYASPEGSAELNQKLSEARAEAVKNALVKKYKIDAARLTTKGMGATDKLFEQVEFNRVATFNDNAKAE